MMNSAFSRTTGGAALLLAGLFSMTSATLAQSTKRAVFVATYPNAAQGKITAFTINVDDTLSFVGVYDTSDTGPTTLHISPDGRLLALAHGTASYDVERLDIFRVNFDATLTHLSVHEVPDAALNVKWIESDLLAVSNSNFGGDNSVGMYRYDESAGTLTEIDREDAGGFHTEIVVHPHGRYLYANDNVYYAIRVFEVDPANGTIDLVQTQPTSGLYQFGMDITHTGSRLYAGCGIASSSEKILGEAIDVYNGTLSALPGSPYVSPYDAPNEVAISSDDQFAYIAHGDARIRGYRIENDGSLTRLNVSFTVGGGLRGSLGTMDVMDDLLFVTDNTTAIDGEAGVYVFRINPDTGALTMLGGGLFDPQTTSPEHLALWNPREGIYLVVSPLIGGSDATFRVTCGTPNAPLGLAYGFAPGFTEIPGLNVTLGIKNPTQGGSRQRTDANGEVIWNLTIPRATGQTVWLQAVQVGRVSHVVARQIN